MSPGVLARLFAANQPPAPQQEPEWGPNPYPQTPEFGAPGSSTTLSAPHVTQLPRGHQARSDMGPLYAGPAQNEPPMLEQEPGDLWGQGNIDLADPAVGDPGAMDMRMQSIDDSPMPPTGTMMLDRVEDDGMGVMYDPETEETQNYPMGALPQDLQPGGYAFPPTPPGPLETMYRSPAFGGRMTSR